MKNDMVWILIKGFLREQAVLLGTAITGAAMLACLAFATTTPPPPTESPEWKCAGHRALDTCAAICGEPMHDSPDFGGKRNVCTGFCGGYTNDLWEEVFRHADTCRDDVAWTPPAWLVEKLRYAVKKAGYK